MTELGPVIAFWVLSVVAVAAAIGVVGSRNLFHSAIFLTVVFLAVAGLYLVLVAVLIVFAVMLTHNIQAGNQEGRQWVPALGLALSLFVVMAVVLSAGAFPATPTLAALPDTTTMLIARALFHPYVLVVEVAAVVLLAAMVGAIVIAREERN
jgi:NADH-quinone oxidoreductase subunit J